MWDVWTDEDQVTFRIAGDMLAYVPDAGSSLYVYQFIFRVIVPVELVAQAGAEQLKGLTGVRQDYFLLDLQGDEFLLIFLCKVTISKLHAPFMSIQSKSWLVGRFLWRGQIWNFMV